MPRVEKECPRCKGERGFWLTGTEPSLKAQGKGTWHPCIMCKTQGKIKVASMAEYRRVVRSVTNPTKVQTKQREKERRNLESTD
jgi:hypothetical protein